MANFTNASLPAAAGTFRGLATNWLIVNAVLSSLCALLFIAWALSLFNQRRGKQQLRIFLAQLIAVEFSMAVIINPLNCVATYLSMMGKSIGSIDCGLVYFFSSIIQPTGNWLMVFMAFNRYMAVCWPHSYKHVSGAKVTTAVSLLSWCLTVGLAVPMQLEGRYGLTSRGSCGMIRMSSPAEYTIRAVFCYYLPFAIIGALYAALFGRALLEKCGRSQSLASAKRSLQKKMHVALMLFFSFCWYIACYLPLVLWVNFASPDLLADPRYVLWLRALMLFGFVGNPLIFFIMGKDYRDGFRRTMAIMFRMSIAHGTVAPTEGSNSKSARQRKSTGPS